jgi:hypothetical protein
MSGEDGVLQAALRERTEMNGSGYLRWLFTYSSSTEATEVGQG